MNTQLTKNAQSVQEVLDMHGLQCKVLELPTSTRTALDASLSIGCNIAQIVKSLIFKTKKSHQPVLVLASGKNKVDEEIIKSQVNEEISKADANFTRDITGFAIGGIPPIGHKNKINLIFIDQELFNFDEVWAAAGTPNAVFCIKINDLSKLTEGKIIKIS